MAQYTVYSIYPSALGDPVDPVDVERINELLTEEIVAAGLDDRAKVIVTEDAGRYTLALSSDDELKATVDHAFARFFGEVL